MKSILLCLSLLFPLSAFSRDLPIPQVESLPNGMQVAWFIQEQLPMVDMIYYFPVGYRHDPIGKSGTVELLSELLEKGAGGRTAKQIGDEIESLGASRYVSAGEDHFSVGIHGLSVDTQKLFATLSDIAWKPDFPVDEFTKEKGRLLERWSHIGDYAETLASLVLHRRLAKGSVYSRGSFLGEREFQAITREDILSFYRKAIHPQGAILLMIGRINREEMKPKIEALFLNSSGAPQVKGAPEAKTGSDVGILETPKPYAIPQFAGYREDEVLVVDRPGVNQAQVRMGFNSLDVKSPERYALAVGNSALGETFNSRLNTVVRDQLGLTYSIGSSFTYAKDLASFTVSSFTRNETVGKMILKVQEILGKTAQGDFQPVEIEKSKEMMLGGYPIATSTLGAIASRWLGGVTFGFGPGYLNEFVPRVSAIKTEDVNRAFQKAFRGKKLQIVIAGEYSAIQKSLVAAGIKKTKKISISELR